MKDFISQFITQCVNDNILPKSTNNISPCDRFRRIPQATDRGSKRSIAYWLKLEYDFAYGYAKDFKTGAESRFNSARNDSSMTRADIARIKSLLKIRKAQEDSLEKERHLKIAARAAILRQQCAVEGTTPYLDRKGIPLSSGLILGKGTSGEKLFIPIYEFSAKNKNNLELISWQTIGPDGTKRFPFGGKKKGCFHIIGQINPTKPIVICEGWATGVSLNIHLGQSGYTDGIIVAFDAYNMVSVAKNIRKVYKNTEIIIAADNDESGVGQKEAAKCQKSVTDCSVVVCPEVGKDFNDIHPEALKKAFGVETPGGEMPSSPVDSPLMVTRALPAGGLPSDWQNNIIEDAKGRIVSTSLQNTILYLIYHHDFQNVFAYDEFKQSIILKRCPPWEDESTFKIDRLSDISITQTAATLERYGLNCTIDRAAKAIQVAANEKRFHSARVYFNTLEWDGTSRLESMFQNHFGSQSEAPEYLSMIARKWMTAAIRRVMEPGCKFDHVLILESAKQGLYKSAALKALATFNGETYHTDSVSIVDLSNKDTAMKLQGNMIVELAELSGFSRKDDETIKNWITQTIDEIRIPFSREISKFPRQFVFAATTNNSEYLKDPTGNRRFWPVTIEKYIDIDGLNAEKDQLWAEAVHLYKSGFYVGVTHEENELAEKERAKRFNRDPWDDLVMQIVSGLAIDEFKSSEVIDKMNLKTVEKNSTTMRRVSNILKMNGYDNSPRWDNKDKKTIRLWSKGQ